MSRFSPRSLVVPLLLSLLYACGPMEPADAPTTVSAPLSSKFLRAREPIPKQYIVVLADGAEEVESVAAEHGRASGGQPGRTFHHALRGYVLQAPEAAALRVAEDPRVKYVEEDSVVRADTTQTGATWGLDRIDQRALPLNQTYTYNATGAGVNAYIIDTGIRATHTEFAGRASLDFTAVNDGNGASDCYGHGTHVAGTVGGTTYGVAKAVRLHSVRVLDCAGNGTSSGVIAGLDWVTANRVLPAVANMSLGGGASQAIDDAVTRSINSGVTYAVAAGNSYGADACTVSPARTPAALTIAASTSTDAQAIYSNIGTCVDLYAPGSSITSSWYSSDTATNVLQGTSMATPHVAGAAALYLSANPGATPAQVAAALKGNATSGAITGAGAGTPNLLLYTGFIGSAPGSIPAAGLKMWLRGDTGVVQSGGRVSSWQDQSGSGNNATMATASRQPYYVAGALNGKPVIRFNGAESLYFTSILRMSQSTVFVVAKNSKSTETFNMILGPGGNSANHQLRFENGSSALLVTPNIYTSPIGNTRVYLALSTRYDGSTWSVFRDGVLKSTHGSSPGAWELNQVGAWFSTYFMVGDVAEVIAYDRALSESERSTVNGYLRSKYALP